MNQINLQGYVKNVDFSHQINDVIYQKADIIIKNSYGKEDIIKLIFKQCVAPPIIDNEVISLSGTIRSHTEHLEGKNKVDIYVFTYFDKPDKQNISNEVILDGRICKVDQLRTTKNNKLNFHATLANNIYVQDQNLKINNYIPLVFWGSLSKEASKLNISDFIVLRGQLHSRIYIKTLDTGEKEIRTAHEVVVLEYEKKF